MEREVRYCTSFDGTRIAYSIRGDGPPIVWIPGWISHLDIDFQLGQGMGIVPYFDQHLWVQMDKRGSGLSSRNVSDFSLDARVRVTWRLSSSMPGSTSSPWADIPKVVL